MEYYFALFKSWLEGERDKGVEVPAPCEEKRLSCEPDGEHEFEESTPQCPSPPTPTHSPERILADNLASVAEVSWYCESEGRLLRPDCFIFYGRVTESVT